MTLQGTVKTVTTIIREPLSGTYNTMEYCIPESQEARGFTGRGQEQGISSATNNGSSGVPASAISGAGGVRRRAIGTGQSVNNANTIANALGYAFWSVNTFKANTNLRYLTVDGADPLFDNYSVTSNEGSLQPATTPTFRNVKNGGYPIWSILRAVTDSSTPQRGHEHPQRHSYRRFRPVLATGGLPLLPRHPGCSQPEQRQPRPDDAGRRRCRRRSVPDQR